MFEPQHAIALAPPRFEDDCACYWGTDLATNTTLYVRLASDPEPKALRFTPNMITQYGAGLYPMQSQAMSLLRRILKKLGVLPSGPPMAMLTIMDAARVTGVSRSQLYRYIRAGKLSRTPDGHLDTAELLRAGLMLHVPSVPSPVPEAHDATAPAVSRVPEPVPRVPSADTATLERLIDVLRQELDAARVRETLLTQRMHERETQLTQAAHARETQLLQLLAQMHQQNQRLLDMPRPAPQASPQEAPGATQARSRPERPVPHPATPARPPGAFATDTRGTMRRRIVALLQAHPEGLTPAEMRDLLGVDRSLADTCLGMLRYGLVQRVARGRYIVAPAS